MKCPLCPHGLYSAFDTPLYNPSETFHKGTVPVTILDTQKYVPHDPDT